MCLQFRFVIFWQKDFGAKAAHKMLVKLTTQSNKQNPFFNRNCETFLKLNIKVFNSIWGL